MDVLRLVNTARRSIGTFCYTECHALCCRKGVLPVLAKDVKKVTQGRQEELVVSGRLKLKEKDYRLNLDGGCPSLSENKCTIITSQHRPQACHDYPLFVKEEAGQTFVFASPSCTAVQAGKLYPYIRRLKSEGCVVIEPTNIVSLNLHTFGD